MKAIIRYIKIACILLVALLPSACHFAFTGPWLIAHGSSSAFDMCVGLGVCNVVAGFSIWVAGMRKVG